MRRVLSLDLGRKHFAACLLEAHATVSSSPIRLWQVRAVPDPSARCMAALLRDSGAHEIGFDAVVVERQPGINVHTVRQQALLDMYFYKEGIPVTFQNPAHKWRRAFLEPWCSSPEVAPSSYYRRKLLSVKIAEDFLAASAINACWAPYFRETPKRDDLADALCQALAFLYR